MFDRVVITRINLFFDDASIQHNCSFFLVFDVANNGGLEQIGILVDRFVDHIEENVFAEIRTELLLTMLLIEHKFDTIT